MLLCFFLKTEGFWPSGLTPLLSERCHYVAGLYESSSIHSDVSSLCTGTELPTEIKISDVS